MFLFNVSPDSARRVLSLNYSQTLASTYANCSTLGGVIYPAYASFKAVNILTTREASSDTVKWLTYWAVYASFSVFERALDKYLPW